MGHTAVATIKERLLKENVCGFFATADCGIFAAPCCHFCEKQHSDLSMTIFVLRTLIIHDVLSMPTHCRFD